MNRNKQNRLKGLLDNSKNKPIYKANSKIPSYYSGEIDLQIKNKRFF